MCGITYICVALCKMPHVCVQYMVLYQLLGGIATNVLFYMDTSSFTYNQVKPPRCCDITFPVFLHRLFSFVLACMCLCVSLCLSVCVCVCDTAGSIDGSTA